MTREQNDFITALTKQYCGQLTQIAYRHTGDAELAKDIFQETMLTACCRIETVWTHENVRGWLYTTLWHLVKREMKKAYHTEVSLDPETVEGLSGIELPLDLCLPAGLKDWEREILLLRIGRELSYAEIAEIKGLTECACRQQLSRAARRCGQLMLRIEDGEKFSAKKCPVLSQKASLKGL